MTESPAVSPVVASLPAAPSARRERSCADASDRALRQVMASDGVHWEQHLLTGQWWCSPALFSLLGLAEGASTAASPFERCIPEDRERIDDACAEAIRQSGGFTLDLRLLDEDGHHRWWRCTARVLPGTSGAPEYLAGVLREVRT